MIRFLLSAWILIFLFGCGPATKTTSTQSLNESSVAVPEPAVYRASYTRKHDLVHTKLEVTPDWTKKYLYGKATLTLHPHFYPADSLVLNARGMDIHEVSLMKNVDGQPLRIQTHEKLTYTYDGN